MLRWWHASVVLVAVWFTRTALSECGILRGGMYCMLGAHRVKQVIRIIIHRGACIYSNDYSRHVHVHNHSLISEEDYYVLAFIAIMCSMMFLSVAKFVGLA